MSKDGYIPLRNYSLRNYIPELVIAGLTAGGLIWWYFSPTVEEIAERLRQESNIEKKVEENKPISFNRR